MIKCLLSDFSQVILFPKDLSYAGSLNALFKEKSEQSDFSFFDLYSLNTPLLAYYQELKEEYGWEINIFTSGTVQNHPDLEPYLLPIFSHIFSVTDIRIEKTDPAAYQSILQKLGFQPEEAVFVDDSHRNIEAARQAGLHGIQYLSNDQLKHDMLDIQV